MCIVRACPNYKVNCVTTVLLNIVTANWTLTVFNILEMVDIGDVLNAKKATKSGRNQNHVDETVHKRHGTAQHSMEICCWNLSLPLHLYFSKEGYHQLVVMTLTLPSPTRIIPRHALEKHLKVCLYIKHH